MEYSTKNMPSKIDKICLVFKKNITGSGYIYQCPLCAEFKPSHMEKRFPYNFIKNDYYFPTVYFRDSKMVGKIKDIDFIKKMSKEKSFSVPLEIDHTFKNDKNAEYLVIEVPKKLCEYTMNLTSEKTNPFDYFTNLTIIAEKLGRMMNGINVTSTGLKCDIDSTSFIPLDLKMSVDYQNKLYKKALNITPIIETRVEDTRKSSSLQAEPAPQPQKVENTIKAAPKKVTPDKTLDDKNKVTANGIDVQSLVQELKKDIVGQDNAIEDIVTTVIINQQTIDNNSTVPTSSILIDGPTGTGKTFIIKKLTDNLNLPYVINNASSFSTTGYKGANLTDVLESLLDKTNGDLELAQRSIVIFDEFDKLGQSVSYSGEDMRRGFQDELLTFMEGQEYNIQWHKNNYTFDTSKLTFVGLGAFTDLREDKINENEKKQKGSMGFSAISEDEVKKEYTITAQDYVDAGIKREIIGRFSCITYTNEFDKQTLKNILLNSNSSALKDIEKIGEMNDVKIEIDDEVIDQIVDQAYSMKTGARGLRQVCDSLKNVISMQILLNKNGTVKITSETLEKAKDKMIRKYDLDREGKRV